MSQTAITNLYPAPSCKPPARTWSSNATLATDADGHIMVTPQDATASYYHFSPFLWSQSERFGRWVCYVLWLDDSSKIANISIASAENQVRGIVGGHFCWLAGRMVNLGSAVHEMNIQCAHIPRVTCIGCGYYTDADWQRLQQLMAQGRITAPWWATPVEATDRKHTMPPILLS